MATQRTLRTNAVNHGTSRPSVQEKWDVGKPIRVPSTRPKVGGTLIGLKRLAKNILCGRYGTYEAFCTAEGISRKESTERLAELVSVGLLTEEEVNRLLPPKGKPAVLVIR